MTGATVQVDGGLIKSVLYWRRGGRPEIARQGRPVRGLT